MSFFLLCLLVEITFCLLFLAKHFGKKSWTLLPPLPTGCGGSHLVSLQHFPLRTVFLILLVSSLEQGNSNPVDALTCSPSPAAKSAAAAHL